MLLLFIVLFPYLIATALFYFSPAERYSIWWTFLAVGLPGVVGAVVWSWLPAHSSRPLIGFWSAVNFNWFLAPLDSKFLLAADLLSSVFFFFTVFLLLLVLLYLLLEKLEQPAYFYPAFLLAAGTLFGLYFSRDVFLFYFFWEFLLIPVYLLVVRSSDEKVAHRYLIRSLAGSFLLFFVVMFIYYLNLQQLAGSGLRFSELSALEVPGTGWIFLGLLLSFGLRSALFPLHGKTTALLKELSPAFAVLFVGIVINTGIYGFVRFLYPLTYSWLVDYTWWLSLLAIFQTGYCFLAAWLQDNYLKLIIYSAYGQLGVVFLGLFNLSTSSITGALYQALSYSLIVTGLFFFVGFFRNRAAPANLSVFQGLADSHPGMAAILIFLLFASIGLIGTSGFIGRVAIFSTLTANPLLLGASLLTVLLSLPFALKFIHHAVFVSGSECILKDKPVSRLGYVLLAIFVFLILWLGVAPQYLYQPLRPVVNRIITRNQSIQQLPHQLPSRARRPVHFTRGYSLKGGDTL